MISCEPTPCGRYVFGSTLVVTQGRPALLTAKRTIPHQANFNRRLGDVLNELATEVISEIMAQASSLGMSREEIGELIAPCAEGPRILAKRKAT